MKRVTLVLAMAFSLAGLVGCANNRLACNSCGDGGRMGLLARHGGGECASCGDTGDACGCGGGHPGAGRFAGMAGGRLAGRGGMAARPLAAARAKHAESRANGIPHLPPGGYQEEGPAGPQVATYAYPYYTIRAPRDFLLNNPPSIGP